MKSYFIRHTDGIDIPDEVINEFWENNIVCIHYPGGKNDLGDKDLESRNEEDYKGQAKKAIGYLNDLDQYGGYIWAEYRTQPDLIKVGKIIPNSFQWKKRNWRSKTRVAILKTLRMEKVREIQISDVLPLLAARPRKGTISPWNKIGIRLEKLVEKKKLDKKWENLTTEQQETVCAEYLREPDFHECPKLNYLLLPIGRTLKDVDIYGESIDGFEIFGQVTFYEKNIKACKNKINKLKRYRKKNSILIFFCNCKDVEKEEEILFIPISIVFEWLQKRITYFQKLFDLGIFN